MGDGWKVAGGRCGGWRAWRVAVGEVVVGEWSLIVGGQADLPMKVEQTMILSARVST